MEDKISIIVPVYNVEKYLVRCVDSIRNQTHRNLEIILVDDGSPDGSGDICDHYCLNDSRIRVIHKTNGGLSDARNTGLQMATGEIVGFIDSDDFIHPEMIGDLYARMKKHDADIVQCSFRSVSQDTMVDPEGTDTERVLSNLEALRFIYTPYGVDYVMVCDKLYRKKLFDTICFPVSKIHEDEFTTWKLLFAAEKTVVTDKKYYYYFQSPNSIIRSGFSEKKLHYAEAMEERITFFGEKGMKEFFSLATRKYARWLLLFMYRNRKDLKIHKDIRRNLQKRFDETEKLVRLDPLAPRKLKMVLKNARTLSPLIGFLIYQNLYKRNFIGRSAGWLGLGF